MRELWGSRATGIELDLRKEIESIFSGASDEISKQQTFVLRTARRDSSGNIMPCACVSPLTLEPDTEKQCPFCLGEGFYFDESFIYGYKMANNKVNLSRQRVQIQSGMISAYDKIFFLRYNELITYDDKIIELKLDSDGKPLIPYKRKGIHRPETIIEYRSDNGRIEFLAIYVNENNSIRVK